MANPATEIEGVRIIGWFTDKALTDDAEEDKTSKTNQQPTPVRRQSKSRNRRGALSAKSRNRRRNQH